MSTVSPVCEMTLNVPSALTTLTTLPVYRVVAGPPGSVSNKNTIVRPVPVRVTEPSGISSALKAPAPRKVIVAPVVSLSKVLVPLPAATTARGPAWTGLP